MSDSINNDNERKISREVINYLIKNPQTPRHKITNLKGRIGKNYKYHKVIKNAKILEFATEDEKEIITPILKRRTKSLRYFENIEEN